MAVDLNYVRSGPAAGTGRHSLVLLHGIGSRWQMWVPVLDLLSATNDVLALDLPGFGDSPPLPAEFEPGAGGLAQAVGGFLTGLGIERPHVAGNSLGGWVALEMARRGEVSSVTAPSIASTGGLSFSRGGDSPCPGRSAMITSRCGVSRSSTAPQA